MKPIKLAPHGAFSIYKLDPEEGQDPHKFTNQLFRIIALTGKGELVMTGEELLALAAWTTQEVAKQIHDIKS